MALAEINRVLKPGGRLLLSAPQSAGDHFEPHHYFNFTQYGLWSLLARTGFSIEEHHRPAGTFAYVGNRIDKLGQFVLQQAWGRSGIVKRATLGAFAVGCNWCAAAIEAPLPDACRHRAENLVAVVTRVRRSLATVQGASP